MYIVICYIINVDWNALRRFQIGLADATSKKLSKNQARF